MCTLVDWQQVWGLIPWLVRITWEWKLVFQIQECYIGGLATSSGINTLAS